MKNSNKPNIQEHVQPSISSQIKYKEYKIRKGTVDEGKDSKVKLISWTSLRCINENVQKLYLLTNAEVCEDFDDLGIYSVNQQSQRSLHLMQLKLKHKSKPTEIAPEEFNSFSLAAEKGKIDILKYLVLLGVDVNDKDNEGSTTIHRATAYANEETIRYVISLGCDCNSKNNLGNTPFLVAVENGKIDTLKYLVLLMDININENNNEGFTDIHCAAALADKETIEYLVSIGFDCNVKTKDIPHFVI